jgi:magnesium chelatase family protein
MGAADGDRSEVVRERVLAARARQRARSGSLGYACNAFLPGPVARRVVRLGPDAEQMLARAVDRAGLTGRGFDRVLKVARTIADLDGAADVRAPHVIEALSFRTAFETREGLADAV